MCLGVGTEPCIAYRAGSLAYPVPGIYDIYLTLRRSIAPLGSGVDYWAELYLKFCEDSGGDTSSGSGCDDEDSRRVATALSNTECHLCIIQCVYTVVSVMINCHHIIMNTEFEQRPLQLYMQKFAFSDDFAQIQNVQTTCII